MSEEAARPTAFQRQAGTTALPPLEITVTREQLVSLLAEGFHTAFRKAIDCPEAMPVHRAISDLPDEDYGAVIEWVVWSLEEMGVLRTPDQP